MVRFARPRTAAAMFLCSLAFAAPPVAMAQDDSRPSLREAAEAAGRVFAEQPHSSAVEPGPMSRRTRPGALVPLYVSFSALQVLDTHSTSRALAAGSVEANPVMQGFAGNEAGMLAVKAAATGGVIYASEKIWKRNRKAAVIFMVGLNATMTWVVQHNYRANR